MITFEREVVARILASLDGAWVEINAPKDVRVNKKPKFHRKEFGDQERWPAYLDEADQLLNEISGALHRFPQRPKSPAGEGAPPPRPYSHFQGAGGAPITTDRR